MDHASWYRNHVTVIQSLNSLKPGDEYDTGNDKYGTGNDMWPVWLRTITLTCNELCSIGQKE